MAEKNSSKAKTAAENTDTVKKTEKSSGKSSKAQDKKSKGKKVNPAVKYFRDLRSEFKKVVWPTKETVVNNTGIVLLSMILTGAGVFALDLVFAEVFKLLMQLAGG